MASKHGNSLNLEKNLSPNFCHSELMKRNTDVHGRFGFCGNIMHIVPFSDMVADEDGERGRRDSIFDLTNKS